MWKRSNDEDPRSRGQRPQRVPPRRPTGPTGNLPMKNLALWVLLILIGLLLVVQVSEKRSTREKIAFNNFLEQVDAKNLRSVSFTGTKATGEFKVETSLDVEGRVVPVRYFEVPLSGETNNLAKEIYDKDHSVKIEYQTGGTNWTSILLNCAVPDGTVDLLLPPDAVGRGQRHEVRQEPRQAADREPPQGHVQGRGRLRRGQGGTGGFGHFVPFPARARDLKEIESQLHRLFRREKIGAILVEPIQARGGIRVPPSGFLPLLRRLCDRHGALLILDEIYTGFGRTGKWFACEHSRVTPDVICLGKALTGGFPLSACVGRADLMDAAWPASSGEAIHTSTFLGHPVGCAMALAQIKEIKKGQLTERSRALGEFLRAELETRLASRKLDLAIRGRGLMAGVELRRLDGSPATDGTLSAIKTLLQRGFIFLPEGAHSNVIAFTPPLTITRAQLKGVITTLADVLKQM